MSVDTGDGKHSPLTDDRIPLPTDTPALLVDPLFEWILPSSK